MTVTAGLGGSESQGTGLKKATTASGRAELEISRPSHTAGSHWQAVAHATISRGAIESALTTHTPPLVH